MSVRRFALCAFFTVAAAHALGSTPLGADATRWADRCFGSLEGLNENASIPLDRYRQNNGRWWMDYERQFFPSHGPEFFRRQVDTLEDGALVIDVGSGKGVALMQLLGERPKLQGLAINVQNPVEHYERVDGLATVVRQRGEDALEFAPLKEKGMRHLATVDGVFQRDLAGYAKACGFPLPRWMRQPLGPEDRISAETAAEALEALGKAFRAWRESAPLETEVGSALEKLVARKNSAMLITDVYGAFFYGDDRIALLEAYYGALKPGGKAFVALGSTDEYAGDLVYRKGSVAPTMLSSYLVGRFPDVSELAQNPAGKWFLILKKSKDGPAELRIPLRTTKREEYRREESRGFVVPQLTFSEE